MSARFPALESLQKYLAGEPLNPELQALRDGKAVESDPQEDIRTRAPIEAADRELTRAEQQLLRQMRILPGWPVLARLQEKTCRIHEKAAIILAQGDPFADREKIIEAFAYSKMYRRACNDLMLSVEAEMMKLEIRLKKKKKGTGE